MKLMTISDDLLLGHIAIRCIHVYKVWGQEKQRIQSGEKKNRNVSLRTSYFDFFAKWKTYVMKHYLRQFDKG